MSYPTAESDGAVQATVAETADGRDSGERQAITLLAGSVAVSDRFLYLHSEIRAARRQIAGGAHAMAEGIVRLAVALEQMDATRAYLEAGYSSFEEYVKHEHALSSKTARRSIATLRSLGAATYRELLINVGVQRTFLLGQLQEFDRAVFEELIAPVDGTIVAASVPVATLEQLVVDTRAELAQALLEQDQLRQQLTAAQTISKTATARLAQVEQMNSAFATERDRIARTLEREQEQHQRTRTQAIKARHELEQHLETLKQQLAAAQATPPFAALPPAVVEQRGTVVGEPCDPVLLGELVRWCGATLQRYRDAILHGDPDQLAALAGALADLIASGHPCLLIAALQACAAGLRQYRHPAQVPSPHERELKAALAALSGAVQALYPKPSGGAHVPR